MCHKDIIFDNTDVYFQMGARVSQWRKPGSGYPGGLFVIYSGCNEVCTPSYMYNSNTNNDMIVSYTQRRNIYAPKLVPIFYYRNKTRVQIFYFLILNSDPVNTSKGNLLHMILMQ